jgi:predicted  nucleic acid-binding Zn-ribbon protein
MPTAEENYYYYKGKCEDAYMDKQRAKSEVSNCRSQALNFEKRLEGIRKLISMLEDDSSSSGVAFSVDRANSKLDSTDGSFRECIQCKGVPCADLNAAFKVPSVVDEPNSMRALELLKREEAYLDQSLRELDQKINRLYDDIDSLTQSINYYSYEVSCSRRDYFY